MLDKLVKTQFSSYFPEINVKKSRRAQYVLRAGRVTDSKCYALGLDSAQILWDYFIPACLKMKTLGLLKQNQMAGI